MATRNRYKVAAKKVAPVKPKGAETSVVVAPVVLSPLVGSLEWHLALVEVGRMQEERAESDVRTWVAEARSVGASWHDIGGRLGVSRQAATKRFGP